MLICRQKIAQSLTSFDRYCKRYCKLAILGTLGMTGQVHSKSWYKHVENVNAYLPGKNQLYNSFLSEVTVKIVPTCYSCIPNYVRCNFQQIRFNYFEKVATLNQENSADINVKHLKKQDAVTCEFLVSQRKFLYM